MTEKTKVAANLTLKDVVAESGLSPVYVRRAILEGKLPSKKVQVGSTKVVRHEIMRADFETWRKGVGTHTRRADGRSKFALYATPEEFAKLQKLIEANKLETPVERAHQPKPKAEANASATANANAEPVIAQ